MFRLFFPLRLFNGCFVMLAVAWAWNATMADEFRFQESHPGVRPTFVSVAAGLPGITDPTNLLSQVGGDAQRWQFAWFVYGESNSRSVIVGLQDGEHVFVDLNRDQQFSAAERLLRPLQDGGTEQRTWRTSIQAEFLAEDKSHLHYQSALLLRLGANEQIEIATAGAMLGTLELEGKNRQALRIDRNANGRWFDAEDRILLDKNLDGKLNPIGERLACDGICVIDGRRYVMHSDLPGLKLELNELRGSGQFVARIRLLDPAKATSDSPHPNDRTSPLDPKNASDAANANAAKANEASAVEVSEFYATLVSRSGVRLAVRSLGKTVECPVGEYRVDSLRMDVAQNRQHVSFRFASFGSQDFPIKITGDQTTEFDILGEIALTASHTDRRDQQGRLLTFTPLLSTTTGLYLESSFRGIHRADRENRLHIELTNGQQVLDRGSTGFA